MAFIKDYPALPVVSATPCIYLRNKAMYLRGTVGDPENYPEDTNASACWCNKTQHFVGPDQQYVNREQCIPGRECYCETY